MKKTIHNITRITLIVLISFLLSKIPYCSKETIINIEFMTTSCCTLFGVALAILALLFTVIDRYKDNCEKNLQKDILKRSLPVLKNIGDDIVGILTILIFLFSLDILSITIDNIQNYFQTIKVLRDFDILRFLLILSLTFLLCITVDITIVVITLIKGLFILNSVDTNDTFEISLKERDFLTYVRKLKPTHIDELLNYTKILYTKQSMEDSQKDK